MRHKPFSSFISLNQSGDFYHPFLIDFFRGAGREAVEGRKKLENKIPLWLQTFLPFPPTLTQLHSLRPYFFFMWLENAPIITQSSTYDSDKNSGLPCQALDPDIESQSPFLQRSSSCKSKALWFLGHFPC